MKVIESYLVGNAGRDVDGLNCAKDYLAVSGTITITSAGPTKFTGSLDNVVLRQVTFASEISTKW